MAGACFALGLALAGCGSDPCEPGPCCCEITLENVWPNDDGRGWEYTYTYRTWDAGRCDTYESEDEVPPAPSMDAIEDLLLGGQPAGPNVETGVGFYEMVFSGDSTTMSGVTAQGLRETAYLPDAAGTRLAGMTFQEAFLARLFLLKPSARGAILRSRAPGAGASIRIAGMGADIAGAGAGGPVTVGPMMVGGVMVGGVTEWADLLTPYPVLIHGGVWEKTETHIGTYGDVDEELAWKFLGPDLCAGREFTFQLVPGVAPDVFLHCRVLGTTGVETDMGLFQNGLRCLYMVDYGISEILLPAASAGVSPSPAASPSYWRAIDYGEVVYVPDVGPVYSYARNLVCVGEALSQGVGDTELSLKSTGGTKAP